MNDEFKEITPALAFIDGAAFVTVPVVELVDGRIKDQVYVVSSAKDRFLLADTELIARGYYSDRKPSPPQRWSKESLESFLAGDQTPDFNVTFNAIVEQFNYYIDFGDQRIAKFIACWIIGTYFHRLFTAFPYIHLNGTMESGKSKTLSIVAQLAFNGELTVSATPAYVIRVIHDNHATCCIDEIENLQRAKDDGALAVIGMYNAGYKKGSFVGKAEQSGRDNNWRPKRYEAYSPKIFASINGLEGSLASRTIPVEMVRSTNNSVKNREVPAQDVTLGLIRDQLYPAMLEYFPVIQSLYEAIRDEEIVGREWELWKPILAVSVLVDPDRSLYDELHQLAVESGRHKKDTVLEGLVTPKLLDALQSLLMSELNGEGLYPIPTIISHLIETDEETFGWLKDSPKSGRWLGNELRKAGVVKGRAVPIRIGETVVKGFSLDIDVINKRLKAFE